jgi:hypothetical protein
MCSNGRPRRAARRRRESMSGIVIEMPCDA